MSEPTHPPGLEYHTPELKRCPRCQGAGFYDAALARKKAVPTSPASSVEGTGPSLTRAFEGLVDAADDIGCENYATDADGEGPFDCEEQAIDPACAPCRLRHAMAAMDAAVWRHEAALRTRGAPNQDEARALLERASACLANGYPNQVRIQRDIEAYLHRTPPTREVREELNDG